MPRGNSAYAGPFSHFGALAFIIREEWNNDEILVGTTHDCD